MPFSLQFAGELHLVPASTPTAKSVNRIAIAVIFNLRDNVATHARKKNNARKRWSREPPFYPMNTRANSFLGMRGNGRGGEGVVGMRPCGDGPWGGGGYKQCQR